MALERKNYDPATFYGAVDSETDLAISDGKIIVGDSNGAGSEVTVSGDATLTNTGVLTVANDAITQSKLASDNYVVAKQALAAGNANDFAFAWQNPESSAILVDRVVVDITTAGGTATAVIDVGVVAGATATADTILDGIDANAVAVYDSLNATDNGTSGVGKAVKVDANGGTNDYITGKILVANAASMVGNVYIYYRTV